MDYQNFLKFLPNFNNNLDPTTASSKYKKFQELLLKLNGELSPNIMELLDWAVNCMDLNECYCQIGCNQGLELIGALVNHKEITAFGVEDFSTVDDPDKLFNELVDNLSIVNLEEEITFCNQNLEEFFAELKQYKLEEKIGVYVYNADTDYRKSILSLMLAKPFLADQALIIIQNSNYNNVQQANYDFLVANPEFQLLLDLPTPEAYYPTFGNGIQIFSWDIYQKNHAFAQSPERLFNLPFTEGLEEFGKEFEFKTKKKALDNLSRYALEVHGEAWLAEAEKTYKRILLWDPGNAEAIHGIGIAYFNGSQYQQAKDWIIKAIGLAPLNGQYHYNLALIYEKLDQTDHAKNAYLKAIDLNSNLVDACNNLGNLFFKEDNLDLADNYYRQAAKFDPNKFGSYLNLGNILLKRERFDEAIEIYNQGLTLQPKHPAVLNNIGLAYQKKNDFQQAEIYFAFAKARQGEYKTAIEHFEKIINDQSWEEDVYLTLSLAYQKTNDKENCINTYKKGLEIYPKSSDLYLNLIFALQAFGETKEGITIAEQGAKEIPDNIALKLESWRLLPIVYDYYEEIEWYRQRFTKYINELIKQIDLTSEKNRKNALEAIRIKTNFYLQYQGKNDLELQVQYGDFVHRVMAANYPQFMKPRSMPPLTSQNKIRVGYISSSMRTHTVGKLLIGWLRAYDRDKLEVYSYHIHPQDDLMTNSFRLNSDHFHHISGDVEDIGKQILEDNLHILVYLDIGMDAKLTQLAALRLAPIQCQTWGHPITSGLPTMDYFLSSDLMEPDDGEKHYAEQLIRLPGIGISYAKPVLPELNSNRQEFGLKEDAIIYLSCQSTFKYLPQYDYIFPAIAKQVPKAQFVFIKSPVGTVTEQFQMRLKRAFAEQGMDSDSYCVMLPRLNQGEYFQLNCLSDIFLDTFSWSGGNTTLEAIACNLPVVTCPGEFMRGRHAYGILKMLRVTETIASDETEYIKIAVRLGSDYDWRQQIADKIEQSQRNLYNDLSCIRALETFYEQVVQEQL